MTCRRPRGRGLALALAAVAGCGDSDAPVDGAIDAGPRATVTHLAAAGLVARTVPAGQTALLVAGDAPFDVDFVDAAGQPATTLAGTRTTATLAELVLALRWSPDGARLAVVWERGVGIPELGTLERADLLDGDRRLTVTYVGHGRRPSWSADGGRLLHEACQARVGADYLDCEGSGQVVTRIWLYERATGEHRDLTGDNLSERGPDWIPGTDDYVLATGRRPGAPGEDRFAALARRRLLDPADALVRVYTAGRGNVLFPQVAPDRGRVAFVQLADAADRFVVHTVALTGGPATAVDRGADAIDPRWSPDGAWLGFVTRGGLDVTDPAGVVVDRLDGATVYDWCPAACAGP